MWVRWLSVQCICIYITSYTMYLPHSIKPPQKILRFPFILSHSPFLPFVFFRASQNQKKPHYPHPIEISIPITYIKHSLDQTSITPTPLSPPGLPLHFLSSSSTLIITKKHYGNIHSPGLGFHGITRWSW